MDLTQAGFSLREQLGVEWSALGAAQYLTADEVMLALAELPEGWREDGITRKDMMVALLFASYYCATANPKGAAHARGALVRAFQANEEMGSVLRDLLLFPEVQANAVAHT